MPQAMFAGNNEEHGIQAAFALPTNALAPIKDAASQLGVNLLALLAWLWQHPDLIAKIITDIGDGDLVAVVADIVAAWKASHP